MGKGRREGEREAIREPPASAHSAFKLRAPGGEYSSKYSYTREHHNMAIQDARIGEAVELFSQ